MVTTYGKSFFIHYFKQHVATITKLSHYFDIFLEIPKNNCINFLWNK